MKLLLLTLLVTRFVLQRCSQSARHGSLHLQRRRELTNSSQVPSRRLSALSALVSPRKGARVYQRGVSVFAPKAFRSKPVSLPRQVAVFSESSWPIFRGAASDVGDDEPKFDPNAILTTVVATYGIGLLSMVLGTKVFHLSNWGFGGGTVLDTGALLLGVASLVPLLAANIAIEMSQEKHPALAKTMRISRGMMLELLGARRNIIHAAWSALAIGMAAGIGEELAFRGVMQTVLADKLGKIHALWVTSALFGAMHAVTPIYALYASIAGAYFGWLWDLTGNLVIPIISHAVYDAVVIFFVHIKVTQLPRHERLELVAELQQQLGNASWNETTMLSARLPFNVPLRDVALFGHVSFSRAVMAASALLVVCATGPSRAQRLFYRRSMSIPLAEPVATAQKLLGPQVYFE